METIDVTAFVVTDDFFGPAYIDADEERDEPEPYRYMHGGFRDTDTRFSFCFPRAERYQGRMYQPLEGANAGHEHVNSGPLGLVTGGLEMAFRLGGYTVESNMGHKGDVMDPKAGPDPTIYGFRAAAECARFSKHVAAQVYGAPPQYSYVFGGSGRGPALAAVLAIRARCLGRSPSVHGRCDGERARRLLVAQR